jgi:hypothetical protein
MNNSRYIRFILLSSSHSLFHEMCRGRKRMEEQEARSLLGRRMNALRLRRELTQEALGERAGLN